MESLNNCFFCWLVCAAAALSLSITNCVAGEIIYIKDLSKKNASDVMTDKDVGEVREELDQYSTASKLEALKDGGRNEVRFWITYANFDVNTIGYDTVGYIFSEAAVRICHIKYPRKSRTPFKGSCKISKRTTEYASVLNRIQELEKYKNRYLGCEVMDGAWMQIDGLSVGRRFLLSADNPDSCNDEGSKAVADVLAYVYKMDH